jgi:membrane-associated phospholipid phosphatase
MSITDAVETIEEADVAVAKVAAPLQHHPVTEALGKASEIADQPPMFTLGALVLGVGILAGRPRVTETGLRLLAAVGLATAMKTAVKNVVGRTRPYVLANEGRYETKLLGPVEKDWNSFPSGHTADAVSAARAVARVWPELRLPAYAAAGAVAAIQIPRCAHYPSDIAAGALVGVAAEALADRLLEGTARQVAPGVRAVQAG